MVTARDVMNTKAVSLRPETPVRQIARLLLEWHLAEAPVVEEDGTLLGLVSGGDLVGCRNGGREPSKDWWFPLLMEDDDAAAEQLQRLRSEGRNAREIMSAPAVAVEESADTAEIAALLEERGIELVPVVRDGRFVGSVGRAELIRLMASTYEREAEPADGGLLGRVFTSLDEHFQRHERTEKRPRVADKPDKEAEPETSAAAFQDLVKGHKQESIQRAQEAREAAKEHVEERSAELAERHLSDEAWQDLLRRARDAAENGLTEFLMLRFPSQLCSDGGRAVNVPEESWPETLRGEAAELYQRYETELKSQGFELTARVLDYTDGMPGDIGLVLTWGEAE